MLTNEPKKYVSGHEELTRAERQGVFLCAIGVFKSAPSSTRSYQSLERMFRLDCFSGSKVFSLNFAFVFVV